MSPENESSNTPQINTGGGLAIDGDVNTGGGDFIGTQNIFTEETAYNVQGLANPYLGLRAFSYEDRAIYAGREQLAQETVQQLTAPGAQQTLLFVTGASGSGKSSFAQAALIPLLETHYAAYQKAVRRAVFRPSNQPMAMLRDALQKLHSDLRLETVAANTPKDQINLLLIDQFEELFIQSDASQHTPFCDFLTNLPSFESGRTHILITLRVDYLDELFAIQPLWAIAKEGVELRTMRADDLRNAIQKPLQVKHPQKRFAPELLDRLVQDASEDAAVLPLLQVTLAELWKTGKLVLSNYHSLADAIRQRAETVYAFRDHASADPKVRRPADEQQKLMGILLDLINVSADSADRRDTRQRRTRQELARGSAQRSRLSEELVNARLLAATSETRDGEIVEVIDIIHESLIDNWDRLRDAIEVQRQQLQRRARFKLWLGEWLRNERQDGYLLLTDMQLAEARSLVENRDIEVQSVEARAFYQRSLDQQETERQKELQRAKELAEAQRRRAQTFRNAVVVAGVLFLLAVGAALISFYQTRLATGAALAAQALSFVHEQNLQMATLLSLEAIGLNPARGEETLNETLREIPLNRIMRFQGHSARIWSVAWSPDSKQLASGSTDKTIIVWDAASGEKVRTLHGGSSAFFGVAWSPNSKQLASGLSDKTIIVWDVASGEKVRTLQGHNGYVVSVAWSPNGKQLASGSADKTVIVWDATNGKPVRTLHGHNGYVVSVAWSPDGKQLASGSIDSTVIVWDAASGKPVRTLHGHSGDVRSVAWSPDSKQLASGSTDDTMIVWDAASGKSVRTLLRHSDDVLNVAWSPDGKQLASGSWNNTIQLYPIGYLESPCQWVQANLTLDEWLIYRGRVFYFPTCPQYSTPPLPGIFEAWNTNHDYLFLSMQGWLFLASWVIFDLIIVMLVIWGCVWLVRRFLGERDVSRGAVH